MPITTPIKEQPEKDSKKQIHAFGSSIGNHSNTIIKIVIARITAAKKSALLIRIDKFLIHLSVRNSICPMDTTIDTANN